MIRIAGQVISPDKHARIALLRIKGIGLPTSERICKQAKVRGDKPIRDLESYQVEILRKLVQAETVEGDHQREVAMNIKRLKDIGSYRGTRHRKRLPCRGQRTRTNSRTMRVSKRRKVVKRKR